MSATATAGPAQPGSTPLRVGVEPVDEVAAGRNPETLRELADPSGEAGALDRERRDQLLTAMEVNTAALRTLVRPHAAISGSTRTGIRSSGPRCVECPGRLIWPTTMCCAAGFLRVRICSAPRTLPTACTPDSWPCPALWSARSTAADSPG